MKSWKSINISDLCLKANIQCLNMCVNKIICAVFIVNFFVLISGLITVTNLSFRKRTYTTLLSSTFSAYNVRYLENLDLQESTIAKLDKSAFSNMANLKTLNLRLTNITTLYDTTFNSTVKLEILHLEDNKIKGNINDTLFEKLAAMTHLYLQNNLIENIGMRLFAVMHSLVLLDLHKNHIGNLEPDIFRFNSKLQYLDLSYNYIKKLDDKIFSELESLKELYLQNNRITNLESSLLYQTNNLSILSLHSNVISKLDKMLFYNIPNLLQLDVHDNDLQNLEDDIFLRQTKLQVLNLDKNQISYLKTTTLQHLESLQQLYINNNNLSYLDISSLKNLKTIQCHHNPWNCDCQIRDLHILWKTIGNLTTPTCHRGLELLKNRDWDSINSDEFVCKPTINMERKADTIYANVGDVVNLNCEVTARPKPVVFWMFKKETEDKFVIIQEVHHQMQQSAVSDNTMMYNLMIHNFTDEDEGVYKCSAHNTEGKTEKLQRLLNQKTAQKINEHFSVILYSQDQVDLHANIDDTVAILCNVTTSLTDVKWKFKDNIINDSLTSASGELYKIEKFYIDNHTVIKLTIIKVKLEDEGIYMCMTNIEEKGIMLTVGLQCTSSAWVIIGPLLLTLIIVTVLAIATIILIKKRRQRRRPRKEYRRTTESTPSKRVNENNYLVENTTVQTEEEADDLYEIPTVSFSRIAEPNTTDYEPLPLKAYSNT